MSAAGAGLRVRPLRHRDRRGDPVGAADAVQRAGRGQAAGAPVGATESNRSVAGMEVLRATVVATVAAASIATIEAPDWKSTDLLSGLQTGLAPMLAFRTRALLDASPRTQSPPASTVGFVPS